MTAKCKAKRHYLGAFIVLGILSSPAGAQTTDSVQLTVPSLNMPADQQLELGKAIYQQLLSQGVSIATLVLVDEGGVQISFDVATLAAP